MRPSGYAQHPDYRIDLEPIAGRAQVRAGVRLVADSTKAIRLHEQNHAPVLYLPRKDVGLSELVFVPGRRTWCPFKGEAEYWALSDAPGKPVAWSYVEPYPEVSGIAGLIAFYSDRVQVTP